MWGPGGEIPPSYATKNTVFPALKFWTLSERCRIFTFSLMREECSLRTGSYIFEDLKTGGLLVLRLEAGDAEPVPGS